MLRLPTVPRLQQRTIKWALLILTVVGVGIALQFAPPDGLSIAGYRAILVFILSVVLWVTQILPLAITSLLAVVLLPLLGIMDAEEAYSLFGNKAVFFIIGALLLSTSLVKSGLSKRVALWVLRHTDSRPKRLLAGVYFLCFFASFIMPEHAVAAMMLPIVLQVAHWLHVQPKQSTFGKALFMAMVWGSVIGGVATFLGGGRNILAVALLEEYAGNTIGFLQWALAIAPMSIVAAVIGFFVLLKLFPVDITDTSTAHEQLRAEAQAQGPLSRQEKLTLLVLIATLLMWIFGSERLGLANVAVVAVVAMFLLRIVKWRDAEAHVNWGIILMYGGAIALGVALEKSGAALYVTNTVLQNFVVSPWVVIALVIVSAVIFTEFMSNSAVVAMLMPVALSLASVYHLSPIAMTYIVAVPAGLAFMLPMGSPPNALGYSAGYYTLRDCLKSGVIMNVVCVVVFALAILLWWPIIGIPIFIS